MNQLIRVTNLGPYVTMDRDRWDDLAAGLRKMGCTIVEDKISRSGVNTKRVSRTPTGPKPRKK